MFPLGTVLFPSVVLPLHVFEPRYRATARRLPRRRPRVRRRADRAGERGRRRATSAPTSAPSPASSRPRELPDGRWVAGPVGTRRIRVDRWLPDDPYPRAEVSDWPGESDADPDGAGRPRRPRCGGRSAWPPSSARRRPPPTVELADGPGPGHLPDRPPSPRSARSTSTRSSPPSPPASGSSVLDRLLPDAGGAARGPTRLRVRQLAQTRVQTPRVG